MTLTPTQRRVREQTSALYTATLVDEEGVAIAADDLDTLTLTLYEAVTGTIINSRDAQDVLNANGVTVDAAGLLSWLMDPLDNVIVGTVGANELEVHKALFVWTYGGAGTAGEGPKRGSWEVQIDVEQLLKVAD